MIRCLALAMPALFFLAGVLPAAESPTREETLAAMRRAAEFYRNEVASHGGYVYHYTADLERRWGEGEATRDQIWVQPPGTPTVGMAFLKAYEATGDKFYLDAATDAAEALVYGQLESGGWTNSIDFDPEGNRVAQYRHGKGRGKNNSTFDDNKTQAALRLLMHVDRAHDFQHEKIHEAAQFALDAVLKAQFPNGGFPQVWTGPVEAQPVVEANYPDYDWRTENRIKEYWNLYTLNDNLAGDVVAMLRDAHKIYGEERYMKAIRKLGDFLILAQMPEPQPAWAQQYNYQMQPAWARKFEPAAITAGESQDVLRALLEIHRLTGEEKYLEPVPRALEYLKDSELSDGRLARFYELKTNRPLYMFRRGDVYTLTYDDSDLPSHYAFKVGSNLDSIERAYRRIKNEESKRRGKPSAGRVRQILDDLDSQGRWLSTATGDRLTGQLKLTPGEKYLSSRVFSRNLETLAEYVESLE